MREFRHSFMWVGATGLALTGLFAAPAEVAAQERAPAAQPTAESDSDEVIVTARRRAERLIDVPASVTAYTAEDLRLRGGLDSPQSLANTVVGLDFFNQDSRPVNQQLIIRGAGSGTFVNTESGTGLYFNDVFSAAGSFSGFGPSDLLDLERVEVLRGPQGGLYGRNSLGGSVNLISVRPQDTFSARIEGTVGSKEFEQVEAVLNAPLAEGLAVRGVVRLSSQDDGFYENRFSGRAFDRARESLYRFGALAKPGPSTEAYVQLDFSSLANVGDNSVQTGVNPLTGVYTAAADETLNGRAQDTDERLYQSTDNLHGSFKHDFGPVTLTLLGQYRDRFTSVQFDIDGGARTSLCPGFFLDGQFANLEVIPGVSGETSTRCYGVFNEDTQSLNLEARLDGSLVVAERRVSWLAGVDYRDVDSELVVGTEGATGRVLTSNLPGRAAFFAPLLFPGNSAAQAAFVAGFGVSPGVPTRNNLFRTTQQDESLAVYVSLDIEDVLPNFEVSADVRYTADERELRDTVGFISNGPCVISNIDACTVIDAGATIAGLQPASLLQTFDNVTWAIAGRYAWTDSFNTYVRVGTAYRAGGGNPRSISSTAAIRAYNEEKSISYEVGAKGRGEFGAGVYGVSAAAFFTETEDVIANLRETPVGANGVPTIIRNLTNLGDQEVYGLEFEANGSFPMFGGAFTPTLGVAWTEGEITDSTLVLANTNGQTVAQGTQVARIPEVKITATAAYERALFVAGGDEVTGLVYVAYNEQWGGKEAPDNVLDLTEFSNVDVRIGVRRGGWELAGEVRNATDEDAPVFQNGSLITTGARVVTSLAPRQPRTWMLTLTKRFGGA